MGVRLVVRSTWSSDGTSEHAYEFDQPRIVIGRHRGADVHIPHAAVSGTHATVRAEGARYVIVDEGSTNGTKVSGERIPQGRPKPLSPGDLIEIGGFQLRLEQRPVITATTVEGTAALARRIVEEALRQRGEGSAPRLRVLNGPSEGREVSVPEPPGRVVMGRGEDVDLQLPDEDLSRAHAEVFADLSGVLLRDLDSKNGTFVGDKTIRQQRLRDGDEIRLGKTVVLFEDAAGRRLSQICSAPEEPVELPAPPEPPEPALEGEPSGEAEATLPSAPPASVASPARRSGMGADVFIYVLAGAVLALSIAGLFFLLRAG